ncbi:MAG: hypothetical protein KTR25_02585 [Myxococcales bacterium]|nr:hypothetical protein [Myxococcales bacterium]
MIREKGMVRGVRWRTWLGLVPNDLKSFATLAETRLRQTRGESCEWLAEEAVLSVRGEHQRTILLKPVFETYRMTPRRSRLQVLDRLLAPSPSFPDLVTAQPNILPAIRNRYTFGNELRYAARHWTSAPTRIPPIQPMAEHLGIVLVYDEPETVRMLGQDQLSAWQISFDEALEVAIDNLRCQSEADWLAIRPGLFASPYADFHDAARICLPDVFHRLPIRGQPVVTVPNRKTVLVAGDRDPLALQGLFELTLSKLQEDRPISGIPVQHDGRQWASWVPDTEYPQLCGWSELRAKEISAAYELQRELLTLTIGEHHSPSVVPIPVGAFIRTGCVWPNEGTPLLPAVDFVLFGDDHAGVQAVPLRTVREHLPHLLERAEVWPPRWRALRHPSIDELRKLAPIPVQSLSPSSHL